MKQSKRLLGTLTLTCGLAVSGYSQSFLTNGLVAYYPFNGNALDASGNGNNGIVAGAVLTSDRFNQPSNAYYFNWTNYSIGIPAFFDGGQPNYTISFWFNTASTQQVGQFFISSCPNPTLEIKYNETLNSAQGYVAYSIGTGTDWIQPTQRHGTKNDYQTNTWYQVALVKQDSQFTLYIDGTFDETSSATVPATGLIGFEVGMGCASSTSTLMPGTDGGILGKMDEVRFYNRALSASAVQQLYVYESQTHVAGSFQLVYGRYSWPQAKSDAESRGGHLATFPYQAKWNSAQPLINLFNSEFVQDLWIGGYQPAGSPEPAGNWSWVTGEPWGFTFWWPGEPNNQGGNEDSLMVGFGGAGWNDANSSSTLSYLLELGPRVDLIKSVKPSFSNLTLTTNYQLQVSADLSNWTNQGSPFTATNGSMVYPQYFDVDNWNRLFFRLQVAP